MKKPILIIAILLLAVIGAGVYYVFTNLDAIVKAVIEDVGSQTTQTAVRVDSVNIALTDGGATLRGLSVANPKGFDSRHAFVLGEIDTQIDIKSLTQGPITINKVLVSKPQIFYEMNQDRASNLNALRKNIEAATRGSAADKPAAKRDEPKLIIRRFLLSDATVEATVAPLGNKKYTLKLPTIELTNLGGKTGATPSEISRQVLDVLTKRALAAVKRAGVDEQVQTLKSEAQQRLDTTKRGVESQAKEKLKNLLGK